MDRKFNGGVWPVMLTPFKEDNTVDFAALDELVEWYIARGVKGMFAVCQSSEMFFLTEQERIDIATAVVNKAAGRVSVIASGHVADSIEDQARHIIQMSKTGVDAVVLITNRLADESEGADVWIANLEKLMLMIPEDICLGLYECPYPYKRILTEEEVRYCCETGRFYFLKDTCCDAEQIRQKLRICEGTNLQLYNANTATLLESLKDGAIGYSGVMANMQCRLYAELCERPYDSEMQELSDILTMCSIIEAHLYPTIAKRYLQKEGLHITTKCRVQDDKCMTAAFEEELKALHSLTERLEKNYIGG